MKVYQALARAFAAEKVTEVFGMMGDGNLHWIDELDHLGVPTYEVRHESAGLNMAQGYARISGKVGVATTTCGPGVTQLATSMTIASRARAPIVVYCGESPTGDDDYVQRINQQRFAEAIEAGFVRVTSSDVAVDCVRKAFYQARAESRPVMLSVPMDVAQQDVDDNVIESYTPSSKMLQLRRVMPGPEDVTAAADLIAASRKQVIVVGRGAMASAAGEQVLALAEQTGALVVTTLMAKNWLNDYPFHAGICGNYGSRTARNLLAEADLVIAVGAGLNKYTTSGGALFPNARYLQLDSARQVVMGGGGTASLYLQTDARLGLQAITAELDRRGFQAPGYHCEDTKRALAGSLDDPQSYELKPCTVDPREVCLLLDKMIPSDVGLVLGSGHNVYFSTMLCTKQRHLMLPNQFFGSIGQGLTSTIGAVVASKKPAFLIDGDVSLMMYLSEFETAVRYNLPILAVILNDQAMGTELHKMRVHGLNAELAEIGSPDLGAVARALGGRGRLATTIDDVRSSTEEWLADPRPTMIDARISDNVLSVQYRRTHYGQDI